MKKSEHYQLAMRAVVTCSSLGADQKIEIIETLLADKRLAVYGEEHKNEPVQN